MTEDDGDPGLLCYLCLLMFKIVSGLLLDLSCLGCLTEDAQTEFGG
jgi:hypothetical protein